MQFKEKYLKPNACKSEFLASAGIPARALLLLESFTSSDSSAVWCGGDFTDEGWSPWARGVQIRASLVCGENTALNRANV